MKKNNYNWSIIGHDDILDILEKSILYNRLSHAYLFLGPNHIGKRTIAIRFAQILQCKNKHNKPCLECVNCRQIENMNHPDTQIIEDKLLIKIEDIRNLQHDLSLNSYNSLYKIAIIINNHKMTSEAQNAFLKTLEEPSGNTVIILIADDKNKFLPTIISRCQIISFKSVNRNQIKDALTNKSKKLTNEQLEELVRLVNGKPGLALRFLKEPEILNKREELIKQTLKLVQLSCFEKFNWVTLISKEDIEEIKNILDFWLIWFRDLLLIKKGISSNLIVNIAHFSILKKNASFYQIDNLKKIINKLEKTKVFLKYNVNLKLLLESLFLSLS